MWLELGSGLVYGKIRIRLSLVFRFDYFSGKYIRADTGGRNGIDGWIWRIELSFWQVSFRVDSVF